MDGDAAGRAVAVRLRQGADGRVRGELSGAGDGDLAAAARRDVERILSLDVDGSGFAEVLARDPVLARAAARAPGLRPVLFFTPLHAAAWTIASQRQRPPQAVAALGRVAELAGARVDGRLAFPSPARLAALAGPVPGLGEVKLARLRALGEAAGGGALARDRLRALAADALRDELLALPGIGPFSAELVRIRGVGDPDAVPATERRLVAILAREYGAGVRLEELAERWRPFGAWAVFLLRATG